MTAVEAARAVEEAVAGVFATVEGLRDAYLGLVRAHGGVLRSDDLEPVRGPVLERLSTSPMLRGCGVVVAPGVLTDRQRYLAWWESGAGGVPVRLVLDLDPDGEDTYDYPSMSWFATPSRDGRRAVQGPYMDFRGANTYVYTFALPVHDDGRFLGVAGADVPVQALEPALLAALGRAGAPAVVVAEDRRVVVANSGRWTVGARLKSFPDSASGEFAEVVPVTDELGWVLAVSR